MIAAWQPSASLGAIRARADLLGAIRGYFAGVGVMEVETPLCAGAPGTDPALETLTTRYTGPGHPQGLTLYLQTSPEYAMKRLLAAGSGPIYQICKAFRDGESGRRHNPEFTLLEWYQPGFDHFRLMEEVAALVKVCLNTPGLDVESVSYQALFAREFNIDTLAATVDELVAVARQRIPSAADLDLAERDAWLDLLMTSVIEPRLGQGRLTFVYDYPASQAALAKLNESDPRVAARFELYFRGVELANGFHELSDATEQRKRFRTDNQTRLARGQAALPVDERFLSALQAGLPDCAGVALGLDRLLMLKLGHDNLDGVLPFPLSRV